MDSLIFLRPPTHSAHARDAFAQTPFINELKSSVPPVPGTPSYEAAQLAAQYFPSHNTNLAVLVKSAGEARGQPLVSLVNESTCQLTASVDLANFELDITCAPKEEYPNALGGGCITKAGVVNQTSDLVESIVSQLPLPAGMKTKIEKQIEQ